MEKRALSSDRSQFLPYRTKHDPLSWVTPEEGFKRIEKTLRRDSEVLSPNTGLAEGNRGTNLYRESVAGQAGRPDRQQRCLTPVGKQSRGDRHSGRTSAERDHIATTERDPVRANPDDRVSVERRADGRKSVLPDRLANQTGLTTQRQHETQECGGLNWLDRKHNLKAARHRDARYDFDVAKVKGSENCAMSQRERLVEVIPAVDVDPRREFGPTEAGQIEQIEIVLCSRQKDRTYLGCPWLPPQDNPQIPPNNPRRRGIQQPG